MKQVPHLSLIQCDPAELFVSARVQAIRWDLVPWGLVLDLDVQRSEKENAPFHRGWVVFENLCDLDAPFNNSRVPIGFWAYDFTLEFKDGWAYSSFSAQVPTYDEETGKFKDYMMKRFSVTSKAVTALMSKEGTAGDAYSRLDHQTRQRLGSDDAFLQALG